MTRLRAFVVGLAALAVAGCDSGSCERSGLGCPTEPGERTVVAGVDLDSLFARPTGAEIEAVLAEWRSGPDRDSATVLREVAFFDLGGRETVRVVEGVRAGGPVFVGAVRQPPRAPGDVAQRPVLLVLGDDPDADVQALIRDLALPDRLKDEVAMVFLAYRGGALRVGGRSFRSPAPADPYRADGEDAWSLVTGLGQLGGDPALNPGRLAAIGHGRGGAVALLQAARAKARGRGVPSYVMSLAAPTSFFTPLSRRSTRAFLEGGRVGSLPGVEGVARASAGRVRDGDATIQEARLALLRRSPAFFFAPPRLPPPPFIFAAYGENDIVVPIEDARALDYLSSERGLYLEAEDANHDTIQRNAQVLSTGAVFLCNRLLNDAPGDCR